MSAKAKAHIPLRAYAIVARAVEEGIVCGWNRAFKHLDDPEPQYIQEHIETAVMGALCDVLDFDQENVTDR